MTRDEVAAFWDDAVAAFFDDRRAQGHERLRAWRRAYDGTGRGAVTEDAFPEPYIGPLASRHGAPAVVALGLNPGEADLAFQGRGGVFEQEIRSAGAFSDWAVTAPYLRDPWASAHRPNVYHQRLLTFARRWVGDARIQSSQVLVMELFPWHSDAVTAPMRPEPGLIDELVWRPLADTGQPLVFAFGRDWGAVAERLRLPEHATAVRFSTPARRLRVFGLPSGQLLLVVWQAGYAGPPGLADVAVLRRAFANGSPPAPAAVPGSAEERCVHDLVASTCVACRTPRAVRPPADRSRDVYVQALIETASPGLERSGYGPLRQAKGFLPVRWPADLWYRRYTQNSDAHVAIRPDSLEFRVHIYAFREDRARNNRALDRVRAAVEPELQKALPPHQSIDWRAARGGHNQVCAVTRRRSLAETDPVADAAWIVGVASAWLAVLQRHPMDLLD